MNKLFFASMLAFFLLVPAMQAQANAFAIGDADAATVTDGDWTRAAHPSRSAAARHDAVPGQASAGLRISDALDISAGRVGLPVLMLADQRGTGDGGTMLRQPIERYGQLAQAPFAGARPGLPPGLRSGAGSAGMTPRLAIGAAKAPKAGGWRVRGSDGQAPSTVAGGGPFTLRIGPVRANTMVDELASLNDLIGTLRAAGRDFRLPRLGDLAGELDLDK